MKKDKVSRVLALYSQLLAGRTVQKAETAQYYGVNERSIQRDIEDIRSFFQDDAAVRDGGICDVVYDTREKGYRLEGGQVAKLSNRSYQIARSWPYVKSCSTVELSLRAKWLK